jgi:hypothetical protein
MHTLENLPEFYGTQRFIPYQQELSPDPDAITLIIYLRKKKNSMV